MARTKRNRCRVKSCSVVIDEKYHFCYSHRKWSLHDVKTQFEENSPPVIKKIVQRRFYCEPCGTVSFSMNYTDCKACGHKTEEVGVS